MEVAHRLTQLPPLDIARPVRRLIARRVAIRPGTKVCTVADVLACQQDLPSSFRGFLPWGQRSPTVMANHSLRATRWNKRKGVSGGRQSSHDSRWCWDLEKTGSRPCNAAGGACSRRNGSRRAQVALPSLPFSMLLRNCVACPACTFLKSGAETTSNDLAASRFPAWHYCID